MATTSLPESMRAIQWTGTSGGIEKRLQLNESAALPLDAKNLPENATLVKVEYASLNPIDYKLLELSLFRTFKAAKPPIPAGDFAGTVISTTLPNLKAGDRVFGRSDPPAFGALGEYVVVHGKESVVLLPEGVSVLDASTIGVAGLTAYQCIAPYVTEDSKVLINGGSGGTGTYGIQIAKALGCRVTTTCSGANAQLCKDLGADEVIDYKTTDVIAHLKRQGTQYDVIVDNVNNPALYWNAQHYLKPGCWYNTIAGGINLSTIISMIQMLYLPSWLGGGNRKTQFILRRSNAAEYAKVAELIKKGKVKPVIEEVYELKESAEAFSRLKSGRARGKLVVHVGTNET